MDEPKIYVACLASYNNGILHGDWINVLNGVEHIEDRIHEILQSSPIKGAEEYAIHDFDGFYGFNLSEWEDVGSCFQMAELIEKHGGLAGEVVQHYGIQLDEVDNFIENNLICEADSEIEYAEQLFDDLYLHDIPDGAKYYIDYEAFCRDIFIDDYDAIEVDGKYYIFSNH
jgi:antirestriction protein